MSRNSAFGARPSAASASHAGTPPGSPREARLAPSGSGFDHCGCPCGGYCMKMTRTPASFPQSAVRTWLPGFCRSSGEAERSSQRGRFGLDAAAPEKAADRILPPDRRAQRQSIIPRAVVRHAVNHDSIRRIGRRAELDQPQHIERAIAAQAGVEHLVPRPESGFGLRRPRLVRPHPRPVRLAVAERDHPCDPGRLGNADGGVVFAESVFVDASVLRGQHAPVPAQIGIVGKARAVHVGGDHLGRHGDAR